VEARAATVEDAAESVRLARLMFESMGLDSSDAEWQREGERHVRERLGRDLAVFVVEDPARSGKLIASAAGTIVARLPGPLNPSGRAGYVQWVSTEPAFQRMGAGRVVMEALLDWYDANGVRTVELHATVAGETLYRSLGFDDEGPRALRRRRP
jgi:GNAT superfamily N-acetyltransferase